MNIRLKNALIIVALNIILSLFLFGNQSIYAATPSVPTGVTASATCNSITVSWSAVSGATSYNVSVNGDVRSTTSTSYTYTGLTSSASYDYAVRANNSSGSSAYSASRSITTTSTPSVPTNVSASSTTSSITVSWSAVSGAMSYDVSVNGDIRNTTSTSYTYTGLSAGTTYNYAVRANSSCGSSAYSSSKSITTAISVPSVPSGVTANATCNSVTVSWSAVSGATSYDVSVNGDVRNTTSTSYTYTGLGSGTSYSYAVRANNSSGSSAYSSSQSITTTSAPSVPTNVSASSTTSSITVSWSAVSGATSYDVSVNGDVRNTTSTSYTYTGLTSGTTYNYAVRGNSSCGTSAYSASKSIITTASVPSVPTGVTASATCNSVTVSWSAVSGATSYDVSVNGDVRNTTSTSYTYTGLSAGTTYSYAVRAKNDSGSSSYSSAQSVTTLLSIPTSVTASATSNSVTVSWSAVSGATSYDVSVNGDVRNTTSTSYTYTGLTSGTTYSYAVRSKNGGGSSAYSSSQSIITNATSIPSLPTGIAATATSSTLTIYWNGVSGATSYDVSVNGDVRSTTSTSYTYTGLTSGASYSYAVRAKNDSGSSSYSSSQSITTIPSMPTGVIASATNNTVTISWSAVSGATGYDVSVNGDVRNTASTSYTYTGLSSGTTYSYAVRAKNSSGSSAYSSAQSIATPSTSSDISIPSNVTASATSNSVTVSWSAVSGATNYDVSVNGDIRNTTSTSYTYTGLTAGTAYSYAVRAKNNSDSSSYSSSQSITTIPSVPTGVIATATSNSVTVSWSAVSGAASYDVSVNGDVRSTNGTSYTYTGLTSGTTYSYAVRAKNNSGFSAYSSAQSLVTRDQTLSVPTGVTATATADSITVFWNGVIGATNYDVSVNGDVRNTTSTYYTYTGLTPGSSYTFAVRAKHSSGSSAYSASRSITTTVLTPSVPTGVIATATSNSVTVTWAAVSGVTSYDVSVNGDVRNTTSTSYTYSGLESDKVYSYAVRANNDNGSSGYSSPQTIATTTLIPSIPTGVSATATSDSITVSWAVVSGATNYDVSVNGDVRNTAGTSYTYTGLSSGATYNYAVRANNNNGSSAYSSSKTIVTTTVLNPSIEMKLAKGLQMLSPSLDPMKNWLAASGGNYTYVDCIKNRPLLVKGSSDISAGVLRHIFEGLGAQMNITPNTLYNIYDIRMVAAQRAFAEMVGIADAGGMDALTWSKLSETLQQYGEDQTTFDRSEFWRKFDKHFWLLFLAEFNLTDTNSDIKHISDFLRAKTPINNISPGTDITYLRMILRGMGLPITDFGAYPNLETQTAIKLLHSQAGIYMDYEITQADWIGPDNVRGIWNYLERFANMTAQQKVDERKYLLSSPSWDKIGKEAAADLEIKIEKYIEADGKGTISVRCNGASSIVFDVINSEGVTVFISHMGTTGMVSSENLSFSPGNYSIIATAGTTINNKDYKKKTSAGFIVKAINDYQGPTIGPVPGPTIGPATGPTPAMLEVQNKLDVLLSKYHPYEYPEGYSIADFTWATEYKQRYEKAVKDALEIQGIFSTTDYLEHLYTSFTDTLNTMGPYPPWMLVAGTACQFYMRAFVDASPDISILPDALGINGYMTKKIAKLSTKREFFDKTNYKYLVYGGNFLWFTGPRKMFINDIVNYVEETNKRTDISTSYKNELVSYLGVIKNMNVNYDQSVSDMNFFLNEIDKEYS